MPLQFSDPWWLDKAQYTESEAIPESIRHTRGPEGVALVKLWPGGKTSSGWGLTGKDGAAGFMENYSRGAFDPRRILYGYDRDRWAFAFVMRSLNIVAIDIDGKNQGFEHAEELLAGAPPTLAETSKSGNGMHLYYLTDDQWDENEGFGSYADQIGIVQGVDIRGVGCVYHHNTQRWNGRELATLPKHIADRLKQKTVQRRAASNNIKKVLETLDEEEILIMQDDILSELAKPIPAGKRNTSLFAIGSKMKEAEIPDWESKLAKRADEIGLDSVEAEKIIGNIGSYAP